MAKNEALFRDVNEKVREIDNAHGGATSELAEFLCECGNADCLERVPMTLHEYERIRSNPVHFAFLAGHENPEVERIVERTDRYVVVEKVAGERDIGRETDPRS